MRAAAKNEQHRHGCWATGVVAAEGLTQPQSGGPTKMLISGETPELHPDRAHTVQRKQKNSDHVDELDDSFCRSFLLFGF